MTAPSFAAYLGVTFVLVVTPGASTAVVIKNTLGGGRASGIASAAGAALGNTIYAVASGLGLAVLFFRWSSAPRALGIAGAMYFVWLGGSSLLRAWRNPNPVRDVPDRRQSMSGDRHPGESFRQGVGVNLLNPAIASFYLSIVPSFIPAGASWWYFAGLGASHVSMAFVCHSAWALALHRTRHVFERRSSRRALDALAGVTMLLLAVRVLRQA